MPKRNKTRQDKIIADLKRKLATTGTPVGENGEIVEKTTSVSREGTYKLHSLPKVPPTTRLPISTSTEYIKKDLSKTLLLTLLAISFELILYFLLG